MVDVNVINSIDPPSDPKELNPNEEGIEVYEDSLNAKISEEEFAVLVDNRITRSNRYWDKLKLEQRQKINNDYWIGNQLDKGSLRDDLEKNVENAIFRNLETFIPIATSRTPEVTVTPAYKNQETREFTMDVKRSLMAEWDVRQNMKYLMGRGIRNHNLNFLAVYELGWDEEEGRPYTEEVLATDLVISKNGDFIARYIKDETVGDLLEKFPNKKAEIKKQLGWDQGLDLPARLLDSPVEYIQAWTDEVCGYKYKDVVLEVKKNHHFDYEGREFEIPTGNTFADEMGNPIEEIETKKVYYNYFKKPKKPFIFLFYWNRGIHVFDDTTIVEQGLGPQDWINKRKRQIGMNADSTNGHWISSGDYISKEEFEKIQGGIDEKIWLENGLPADGLMKITGQPLPDYIYTDLQDSRMALDNIMGTHSTTRGEVSNAKTATQDLLAKDQDYGRVDGYIRDGVELFAKTWYEWMYHLYLVYQTEEVSIAIPEDDDFEQDNVTFGRDKVPIINKKDGSLEVLPLIFQVQQGSTLPKNDAMEYQKANQMKDVLAPFDYFKMVGEPNPREKTKNLLMWQMDPMSFFKEDEDVMAAFQNQQMMQQQQAQQEAMLKGGQPGGDQMSPEQAPAGDINQQVPTDGEISEEGLANALRAEVEGMAA